MHRLLIDVDTALGIEGGDIDDAFLLVLIAGYLDRLKVQGVTVAGGNVTLASASRSTRLVCELVGIETEICEGDPEPLDRALVTGHSGLVPHAAPGGKW